MVASENCFSRERHDYFKFVQSFINHAISNSDYIPSNDWLLVNNEVERMWKNVVVAWLKVIYRILPEDTAITTKSLRMVCVEGKILIWHIPDTSPKRHRLKQLGRLAMLRFKTIFVYEVRELAEKTVSRNVPSSIREKLALNKLCTELLVCNLRLRIPDRRVNMYFVSGSALLPARVPSVSNLRSEVAT
jgi:hypothetical protein